MEKLFQLRKKQAAQEAERQRVLALPDEQAHRLAKLVNLSFANCRLTSLPRHFGGVRNFVHVWGVGYGLCGVCCCLTGMPHALKCCFSFPGF